MSEQTPTNGMQLFIPCTLHKVEDELWVVYMNSDPVEISLWEGSKPQFRFQSFTLIKRQMNHEMQTLDEAIGDRLVYVQKEICEAIKDVKSLLQFNPNKKDKK